MNDELFTVARFYDQAGAQILKGRLEAEEIPVYVIFEQMPSSMLPPLNTSIRGITVKVPFDYAEQAMDIYLNSDLDQPGTIHI